MNPFEPVSATPAKFAVMIFAVVLFVLVVAIVLFIADKLGDRKNDNLTAAFFIVPTIALISIGLLYPALRTVLESFKDAGGQNFIGFDNYVTIFSEPQQRTVLRNTFFWVLVTPFVSTFIGLIYAILVDGAKGEALSKALIFLPMAISLVGASIIWKFVYDFRPEGEAQIGLLNQVLVWLGFPPQQWLLEPPLNTFLLIVVLIWIQCGFAMTVLSASIKAIPQEINEAAELDGVGSMQRFRFVTVPSIRPSLIVVLTTIAIGTLKVFDIVRTMTGGQFDTSVIAYEFYVQSFRNFNVGLGAALATLLFILVMPIIIYNVRQLRQTEIR